MSELERVRETREREACLDALTEEALRLVRARVPEPTPQEVEARRFVQSPAIRRGLFELRVAHAAEKRLREERKQRGKGANRSYRGTYDEDANMTCLHQYLDLDPDGRPRGYAAFVPGKGTEPGRFVPVYNPDNDHALDRPVGVKPIHSRSRPTKPELGPRPNPCLQYGAVDTPVLRGLGTSVPKNFESVEGPRSGPFMQYGKSRAPGTEAPIYNDQDRERSLDQYKAFRELQRRGLQVDDTVGSHLRPGSVRQQPIDKMARARVSKNTTRPRKSR